MENINFTTILTFKEPCYESQIILYFEVKITKSFLPEQPLY